MFTILFFNIYSVQPSNNIIELFVWYYVWAYSIQNRLFSKHKNEVCLLKCAISPILACALSQLKRKSYNFKSKTWCQVNDTNLQHTQIKKFITCNVHHTRCIKHHTKNNIWNRIRPVQKWNTMYYTENEKHSLIILPYVTMWEGKSRHKDNWSMTILPLVLLPLLCRSMVYCLPISYKYEKTVCVRATIVDCILTHWDVSHRQSSIMFVKALCPISLDRSRSTIGNEANVSYIPISKGIKSHISHSYFGFLLSFLNT